MTKREREMKAILYKRQRGRCNAPCGKDGQRRWIPFDLIVRDHIKAQKQGGPDTIENLQLLCGYCNSVKRAEPMEYLMNHHRMKREREQARRNQLTIFSSEGEVKKRQVVQRSEPQRPQRQHRSKYRGPGLVACMVGFLLSSYWCSIRR